MSTRRLEMCVEQMKTRTTAQLAELGKKSDAINQLKKELGDKTAAYFALEAHDKTLLEQLRATEEEFQQKTGALRDAERVLGDKEAELSKLVAELGDQSLAADSQRVELAALRTQVEAMKVSVADYESTMKETEERLARERGEAAATASDLNDACGRLEGLNARTAELERQLVAQTAEAELFNRRVRELEGRLGEQGKHIAEREYEIERLRGEAEAASKIEGDLRRELAAAGQRGSAVVEKYKSDAAQLEAQLGTANEERGKLQAEIENLKREAESSWASERVENALLRERINDVAAEVARLTAALEGPDSPIDALLAGTHDLTLAAGPSNGNGSSGISLGRGEAGPARIAPPAGQKSTLADRIRALQSSASRVAKSN
jgi:chromosome segregation ATPase